VRALSPGIILLFAAGAGACDAGPGSGGAGAGGAAGAAGAGGGGAGAGGASGGQGGSGGAGGARGDGNDSFKQAIELTIGASPVQGQLEPLDGDRDYYSFQAAKGDAIIVLTVAKPDVDPFSPAYPDLVVTLYDESGVQIAENDDPVPRTTQDARILTVVPETGTYYLEVSEYCFSWAKGPMQVGCNTQVESPYYSISVGLLNPLQGGFAEETEPNDAPATASLWDYQSAGMGKYLATVGWGDFALAGDVDVFQFTPPGDVNLGVGSVQPLYDGRFDADFSFLPAGPNAGGSVDTVGIVRVIDAATLEVLAELDVGAAIDPTYGAQLSVPLLADGSATYYLTLDAKAGASGPAYFYFVWGVAGAGNPVEGDPMWDVGLDGNDAPSAADVLYGVTNADGSDSYFVEGNVPAGDADHYQIPNDASLVTVLCSGLAIGSGATLRASVVGADGLLVHPLATADETLANGGATFADVPTPAAGGEMFLRVEAIAQNAAVTGDHYRCGVRVRDP